MRTIYESASYALRQEIESNVYVVEDKENNLVERIKKYQGESIARLPFDRDGAIKALLKQKRKTI